LRLITVGCVAIKHRKDEHHQDDQQGPLHQQQQPLRSSADGQELRGRRQYANQRDDDDPTGQEAQGQAERDKVQFRRSLSS